MNAELLNRIGIILNFLAGFMVAPEVIGLERLKSFENSLEKLSEKYNLKESLEQGSQKLEFFVKNNFHQKFTLRRIENINLFKWVVISLMLIVIPLIIQIILLKYFYEFISSSTTLSQIRDSIFMVALITIIGSVTVNYIDSIEPLIELSLRRSKTSIAHAMNFLFFGFFRILYELLFISIYAVLALIFLSIVLIYSVFRGKPTKRQVTESLRKLQGRIFLFLKGSASIIIIFWMAPIALAFAGVLGLLGVLPIIFYRFLASIIYLLEPENSRLESLLVAWGVLFFIVGNLLQFIATF